MSRTSIIDQLRAAGVECYTRKEWGSRREADGSYARRRSTHPMPSGPADFHFLHLSVTRDGDTVRDGKAGAQQIETFGYSSPPMVSYQDLVTNEGRYFEGQSYGVKGTHTVNDKGISGFPRDLNRHGYACALMQNVDDEVTDVQVDVVAKVFAARELAGLVKRGAPIYPHRKFAPKACPGDKAMARLDEIRRLKDHYVRNGLGTPGDDIMAIADDILAELKKIRRAAERSEHFAHHSRDLTLALGHAERARARDNDADTQAALTKLDELLALADPEDDQP